MINSLYVLFLHYYVGPVWVSAGSHIELNAHIS